MDGSRETRFMRVPLAPAGRREMLLISLLFGGMAILWLAVAAAGHPWAWPLVVLFVVLWAGGLAFFRDPERSIPSDADVMLAPADGRVVEVVELDYHEDIGGPALRISMFLSVFNVHVNRAPCGGVVRSCRYQQGCFHDARTPECAAQNEANTIVMDTAEGPVVVRQIAGKIARRIVCSAKPGDRIEAGQRIGLIKFGSRTELILPGGDRFRPMVQLGEHTVGAVTILARKVAVQVGQERAAALTKGS